MSKTMKKNHTKKSVCVMKITQGKRKGQLCGARANKDKKCKFHSEDKTVNACHEFALSNRRYEGLLPRILSIIECHKNVLKILKQENSVHQKKLYGIRIFLKDPKLKIRKDYDYIHFNYDQKYNALNKKRTLKRRGQRLVKDIETTEKRILILEEIIKFFAEKKNIVI